MKKNITINLCGRLFQIDEDAYKMLQHYIESLRSAFGKQEGGEEIVDDIETRIAELFHELKQNGTEAITIEHVKEIITRIGEPEQLTGQEKPSTTEDTANTDEQQEYAKGSIFEKIKARVAGKRLYRNPDDKMVAGVLSGFATYTNTDPSFWRLLTVIFTCFYGFGFLAYIILAILLPEAKTPEQKLQMMGKEVTPQNLADVVVDKEKQAGHRPPLLINILSILLKIVFGIFVGMAILVCFVLFIGFLFALVTCVLVLASPSTLPFGLEEIGLTEFYQNRPWVLVLFCLSLFAMMLIPIYATIHMVLSLTGKTQPMGIGQRIAWIIFWIISLCCLVACSVVIEAYGHEYQQQINEENSYQGVRMSAQDKHYLKQGGWTLLKHENCEFRRYTYAGEYYTGDRNVRYLDAFNADCMEIYQAERKEAVSPGHYRLTCVARSQGKGVFIYALNAEKHLKEIPAYGNKGGEIFEKARQVDSLATGPEAERMRQIAEVHDGKGYGWSRIVIDDIIVSQPDTIAYGISSDETFTGQSCFSRWFSACDFKLEKTDRQHHRKK